MEVTVLRAMTPETVRAKLGLFTASYVTDWDNWLKAGQSDRAATFAAILRSWQDTRPLPMRRPRAEATHEPPFIEDLLAEAAPFMEALGDANVADLATASPAQIDALHGLWAVFSKLPQRGSASCVGITKAVMLLTHGRIGPAFDSLVRNALGLKNHLRTSEEWVASLLRVGADIRAFEDAHGRLTGIVPEAFDHYQVGRLYDMVLGPGTSDLDDRVVPPPEQSDSRPELPAPERVDISEKLALFDDHWSPRIVGELNGQHVKLVKFRGEFVWHKHEHEDELFLVVHGRFRMEYRHTHIWIEEGQFVIVPRGVEHRPVAEEEVHVMLFEPAGTLNTGDCPNDLTVVDPHRI